MNPETAILYILGILFAVYNGQFIKWGQTHHYPEQRAKWSARWHRTGFILRALLFALIWHLQGIGPAAIFAFISYPIYNGIINMYLKAPFFYIGKTAWMDKNIPHPIHYLGYIILLLLAIYLNI